MKKTKNLFLAILSFLCFVCLSLSLIFFVSPKTPVIAESQQVLLTFDDSSDKNNFSKSAGNEWEVGNGVFNDRAWGRIYYNKPISTNAIRVISLDFNLASTSVLPSFMLVNKSMIGKDLCSNGLLGVSLYFRSATSIWLSDALASSNYYLTSKGFTASNYQDGQDHKLEIVIFNKAVSFAIDGQIIFSTTETANAMATKSMAWEDEVYFAFCTNVGAGSVGSYIDNFEIKDYLPEGANVSLDFENSSDADKFSTLSGIGGAKWTVANGVLNDGKWGYLKYNTPISSTGVRIISFDFYIKNGVLPSFGFMQGSQISTAGQQTVNSGVFYSVANTNSWVALANAINGQSGGNQIATKKVFVDCYDSVHRMEIRLINKTISFAIDGQIHFSANEISTQLTKQGITLEDNLYFCFGTNSNTLASYIDNFEIRDTLPGVPKVDFNGLDKLPLSGGDGGSNFYFDQDIKDYTTHSLARMNVYATKAGATGKGYDLTGTDYLAFNVDNQAGINASFYVMFYEGDGSNYGRRWGSAENMPYYLEYSNGTVQGGLMGGQIIPNQESDYFGIATVPSGFVGKIIIPVTSLEVISWSVNTNAVTKYSDDGNAINLGSIRWIDFALVRTETATDGYLKISNPQIYGDYIPAVANSTNRVVNAIKNIGTVTKASESQIVLARTQYDALADKSKVTNYSDLLRAEEEFKNLANVSNQIVTNGKDFTGTSGVAFGEVWSDTPSTVSAWIKVDRGISADTHIGTIVGNMGRTGSNWINDTSNSFSLEVTTNGNLKLEWRKSRTARAVLVAENVDVRTGSYLHVAFTRNLQDGKLALYVNGAKVAEQAFDISSIKDLTFINPVMIGSDYTDDMIHALGYTPNFNGCIADVRVYSQTLTAEQIAEDALGKVQDGLMASVEFISGEDGEYYNSVGANATDAFGWKSYSSLADLNLGEYTFAVFPDTQMLFSKAVDSNGKDLYTSGYNIQDNVLYQNTSWLANNKDALNLKFVMHVGDLTDTLNYSAWATKGAAEMYYAMESMNVLTKAGIPWSISRGNHDSGNTADRLAFWDNGFEVSYNGVDYKSTGYNGKEYGYGSERIANLENAGAITEFGSMNNENMRNTYYAFEVNGVKWLVVALDLEPSNDVIDWANGVIASHAEYKTIITTHAYLGSSGNFMTSAMFGANYGEMLWTKLASKHANVVMFVSGHSSGENVVKKALVGDNGNTVWNFMIDFSQHEFAGNRQTGVFALFGIDDDGKTLHVNYLSVIEEKLFRNINQFSVSLGEVEQTPTEKLAIYDLDGKVAVEIEKDFTGVLPNLERSGHIFLGYLVDGVLYNSYDYKGTETSVKAVFARFTMINGASIRMDDNGMKFASYLDMTAVDLEELGLTVNYGTLIAPNRVITESGKQDYSVLTLGYKGDVINLPSTVQVQNGGYTIINASVVKLSDEQLELELVARGYMTVTYADGTEVTFYAGVTDNARSIKEIAQKLLDMVSKVQTEEYVYAVDGGYSKYDTDARAYLERVAG